MLSERNVFNIAAEAYGHRQVVRDGPIARKLASFPRSTSPGLDSFFAMTKTEIEFSDTESLSSGGYSTPSSRASSVEPESEPVKETPVVKKVTREMARMGLLHWEDLVEDRMKVINITDVACQGATPALREPGDISPPSGPVQQPHSTSATDLDIDNTVLDSDTFKLLSKCFEDPAYVANYNEFKKLAFQMRAAHERMQAEFGAPAQARQEMEMAARRSARLEEEKERRRTEAQRLAEAEEAKRIADLAEKERVAATFAEGLAMGKMLLEVWKKEQAASEMEATRKKTGPCGPLASVREKLAAAGELDMPPKAIIGQKRRGPPAAHCEGGCLECLHTVLDPSDTPDIKRRKAEEFGLHKWAMEERWQAWLYEDFLETETARRKKRCAKAA